MSLAVYKYALATEDEQTIRLPRGAQVLSFDAQGDNLCVWCLVDPTETLIVPARFRVAGTGHPVEAEWSEDGTFLGSAQMLGGRLIFHCWYREAP